mmetsp:Transcript_19413/g.48615  ORF Transcript_19413/g.48615 Transcript_19413/m.48615 type:complete len:243 (+) Transcript_19413:263-991(+)
MHGSLTCIGGSSALQGLFLFRSAASLSVPSLNRRVASASPPFFAGSIGLLPAPRVLRFAFPMGRCRPRGDQVAGSSFVGPSLALPFGSPSGGGPLPTTTNNSPSSATRVPFVSRARHSRTLHPIASISTPTILRKPLKDELPLWRTSKTSGAEMLPPRPTAVHRPTAEFRMEVGKVSAVITTVITKNPSVLHFRRYAQGSCNISEKSANCRSKSSMPAAAQADTREKVISAVRCPIKGSWAK